MSILNEISENLQNGRSKAVKTSLHRHLKRVSLLPLSLTTVFLRE